MFLENVSLFRVPATILIFFFHFAMLTSSRTTIKEPCSDHEKLFLSGFVCVCVFVYTYIYGYKRGTHSCVYECSWVLSIHVNAHTHVCLYDCTWKIEVDVWNFL